MAPEPEQLLRPVPVVPELPLSLQQALADQEWQPSLQQDRADQGLPLSLSQQLVLVAWELGQLLPPAPADQEPRQLPPPDPADWELGRLPQRTCRHRRLPLSCRPLLRSLLWG